jgi:hypothetical protein
LKGTGFSEADEIVAKCLGKRNASAPGNWMIFGRDEYQPIGLEGECLQASDTNGLWYNPDVDDSLEDSTNNFVARSFFDVNVHAGVFDQEQAERLG